MFQRTDLWRTSKTFLSPTYRCTSTFSHMTGTHPSNWRAATVNKKMDDLEASQRVCSKQDEEVPAHTCAVVMMSSEQHRIAPGKTRLHVARFVFDLHTFSDLTSDAIGWMLSAACVATGAFPRPCASPRGGGLLLLLLCRPLCWRPFCSFLRFL